VADSNATSIADAMPNANAAATANANAIPGFIGYNLFYSIHVYCTAQNAL
jgi:hypothetical protein